MLAEDQQQKLTQYIEHFWENIKELQDHFDAIREHIDDYKEMSQKDYAKHMQNTRPREWHGAMFAWRKNNYPRLDVTKLIDYSSKDRLARTRWAYSGIDDGPPVWTTKEDEENGN